MDSLGDLNATFARRITQRAGSRRRLKVLGDLQLLVLPTHGTFERSNVLQGLAGRARLSAHILDVGEKAAALRIKICKLTFFRVLTGAWFGLLNDSQDLLEISLRCSV
ncbi:hypothetical protein D3C76_1271630 [compost metagenome]